MRCFVPIIMMVFGIGVLSLMDALVKSFGGAYPIWQITFLRYLLGLVVISPLLLVWRPRKPSWTVVRANGLRGLFVVGATACFFTSIQHIPLALATSLFFSAPLMIALFGWALLGERIQRSAFVAIGLGLVGVIIICAGSILSGQVGASGLSGEPLERGELIFGLALALTAAICYAFAMVTIRARTKDDPILSIIFLQTAGGVVVSAVPGLSFWVPIASADLVTFLLIGMCGTSGFLLLSGALARANVATLAPIEYSAFLWASLWGYLFFTELPEETTVIGAVLIIIAGLIVVRQMRAVTVEPV